KRPDRRGLEPAAGTCHNDPPLPRAMIGRTLSKKCALLMVKLQSPSPHFIQSTCCSVPCRPGSSRRATKTDKLPSGSQWLHEIKHDGFRVIARKRGAQMRLYSRPGN